jgi:hypothetical protein
VTSSNILKYVFSSDGTIDEVAPRKPFNINLSDDFHRKCIS